MNSHPVVTDITYPLPEEKCLSEVEKAIKQISKAEDNPSLHLESNCNERRISAERKCFENVMDMSAPSSTLLEQQPSSLHCSGSTGGQFYIAIDASTVAAIKGGSHYTLISVEGEKAKTLLESDLREENVDPNKSRSSGTADTNKSVCLELPMPAMATQLPTVTNFPHSIKQEIDYTTSATECCAKSEDAEVRDAENKATPVLDKHGQYSTVTLAPLVPSSAVKENNPERAKEYALPLEDSVRGTECSAFQEECKMEYTPLIPRISTIKQEPELQSCANYSSPVGNYTTPVGNHFRHSRVVYTSGGGVPSGMRRPYPYHAAKSPLVRSYHVRMPWTTCNPQTSAAPSPQMISSSPMSVTPASVSSSGSALSASGITLNSSGEEAKQDSSPSPEFPRVPFNTPDSGEVDMSSVRRVTLAHPDGHQVAQYVRYVDRMRYYAPFSDREDHNQKERERRGRIKESCQKLRALVPGLNEKTDKATVFEHAAAYLDFLKMKLGTKYDEEYLEVESSFSYQ